jgi:hypothetical protein
MQFDLSAVETATLVFIGTLMIALALVVFVAVAAFAALVLLGVGRLAWLVIAAALLRTVHGINHAWDRLVHHASAVEFPAELQGQASPSTGTYPRVALRDS